MSGEKQMLWCLHQTMLLLLTLAKGKLWRCSNPPLDELRGSDWSMTCLLRGAPRSQQKPWAVGRATDCGASAGLLVAPSIVGFAMPTYEEMVTG